jgi:DHA1 family bicyclomycin/chloramphenicol resistance-like MFS transporter
MRGSIPPVWIIVLLVGLAQLSETVYSPSLPEIAKELNTSINNVEHTLTTYLVGFGIGVFFWGRLSDRIGRKPCVLGGLLFYIIGCISCYFSNNIFVLMLSRALQAFGCSVGSVISQSITRDAFKGSELSKVYATVGTSLALFPAIGPILGGFIVEHLKWNNIFLFLSFFAVVLTGLVIVKLPETHRKDDQKPFSIFDVLLKMAKDPHVIKCGIIAGAGLGIIFSYFAEGSFYLMKALGLSHSQYGMTFLLMSLATLLGGITSKRLNNTHQQTEIIKYGIRTIFISTLIFSGCILFNQFLKPIDKKILILITILSQMFTQFGLSMIMSNTLSISLMNYNWCNGTASSLFGLFYYSLVSLFNYGMGELHNGTLLPMPLYFLSISIFMSILRRNL